MKDITNMTGIAAVFVRNFMEAFFDGEQKLFECQTAGKAAVVEAGTDMSDTYLSSLSRRLTNADVISKVKQGRSWLVRPGANTDDFQNFLESNEDWGIMVQGTVQDLEDKARVLDDLNEHGAVRGGGDNLIPRAAFKQLMVQVKEGKLDIVFVKAGLPMGVKHEGETHRIHYVD